MASANREAQRNAKMRKGWASTILAGIQNSPGFKAHQQSSGFGQKTLLGQ